MFKWVRFASVLVPLLVALSLIGSSSFSQSNDASSLLPLESVLNPDGSFRAGSGLTGSFNPAGWRLFLGPYGQPMFSRTPGMHHTFENADSDTGDVHWDDSYPGPIGPNGPVTAIAVRGDDIYFGGGFTGTESIEANNIVLWDGVSWKALGTGVDGTIVALAFVDSLLYVGGSFDHAGGLPAHNIAAWNGKSWSSLGQSPHDGVGPLGVVYALTSVGSDLFVGGQFATAGNGIAVNNIARWDGSAWHALGAGVNSANTVRALATDGVSLFVGGDITSAGGSPANYIARWDGTAWHTLGTSPNDGTDSFVDALAFANGKLYVGGYFKSAGGSVNAANIAEWDGSHWSSPGVNTGGGVWTLCYSGGKLYISGNFTGEVPHRGYVAVWDSAQHALTLLANGLNSEAAAIAGYKGDVYFGGYFTDFSNMDTTLPNNFIARWTGTKWMSLGAPKRPANSIDGSGAVFAVAVKDSDLYLGGEFDAAGTVAANNIVRWESRAQRWNTLGDGPFNGVDGLVQTIYVSASGAIYAGGTFRNAGGSPARNIAKWDGAAWSPLGMGLYGGSHQRVSTITEAISATEYHFYAGGKFDSAGSAAASNIADWTGTAWVPLGTGVVGSGLNATGEVFALQPIFDRLFRHAKLYVGGDFIYAGGTPATHIAVWDAGTWSALGSPAFEGVLGPAYSIKGNSSAIYVGGQFHRAGGSVEVSNIAKWNGATWSSVGKGVDSTVQALLLSGNNLFATGYFSDAGGKKANMIARWDFTDSSWHPLGSGLNDAGLSLTPLGNDIYVGGVFTKAGGKRSYKLAHWNQNVIMASVGAGGSNPTHFSLFQNYPNPFNPLTIIKYTITGAGDLGLEARNTRLVVYDLLGREVAVLVNEKKAPGDYEVRFDGSGLASGVYLYRLTAGSYVQTRKMILVK